MIGLVVVDMQRYYLEAEAPFFQYFERVRPGTMDYLMSRCEFVVPNIAQLLDRFRQREAAVAFLRLCGTAADRSDLHANFRDVHRRAERLGFLDAYPLEGDPYAEVIPALAPRPGEAQFCKTTYSGFTTSGFGDWLAASGLKTLVFTGLATSQCVDTTARDAADRGYTIVHVEDAQADYDETIHHAALYSAQPLARGGIFTTADLLGKL